MNSAITTPSSVLINATPQSSKKPDLAYSAAVKSEGRIPENAAV